VAVIAASAIYFTTRDSPPPPLDQAQVAKVASGVVKNAIDDLQSAPARSAAAYQLILPSLVEIEAQRASPKGEEGTGLGAGVIVRNAKGHLVHGLTTAACVWVTACIGAACAIAEWQVVVLGAVFVLVILIFGGAFEKAISRRWLRQEPVEAQQETPGTPRAPGSEL
jgi:hypothetical protein